MIELFKDRLKKWRKAEGLYQKEAATKLDVSTATIRKWEKGKRTPTKLSLAEVERRMEDISSKLKDEAFAHRGNQAILSAFHTPQKLRGII